jgi:uncharacterized protein YdeI (YjbR/CyaY-like superfamily)
MITRTIDDYLEAGCGRCPLGGTPECKTLVWIGPIEAVRAILLELPLNEEMKWGSPCYSHGGGNIVILSALKDGATLGFFKGALLADPHGLLVKAGENSQAARYMRFTSVKEVVAAAAAIRGYVLEAIGNEAAGLKVASKPVTEDDYPEELHAVFEDDALLKAAFEALTPGRRRGFLIHFKGAKQSATRLSRIEKAVPLILQGKGMHDDYKSGFTR